MIENNEPKWFSVSVYEYIYVYTLYIGGKIGEVVGKLIVTTIRMWAFCQVNDCPLAGSHVITARWRRELQQRKRGKSAKEKVDVLCLNQTYWRRVLQFPLIQRQKLVSGSENLFIYKIFCGEEGIKDHGIFSPSQRYKYRCYAPNWPWPWSI